MGIKDLEVRKVEFSELLTGVAAGRWTMNTALFVTPERCKTVAYSNPIWALGDGMIVRAGNPKRIGSYASVAKTDARIGVVKGTAQVATAKAAGVPADRIVEFGTQEEVIAAIKAGRVDAYPNTALGHRALLASLRDADLALAEPFELPMDPGGPKRDLARSLSAKRTVPLSLASTRSWRNSLAPTNTARFSPTVSGLMKLLRR